MGNPRGVRRDFEALEARRLRAAELLRKGWSQADVAREVGVHRQSVSRWATALGDGGKRKLRASGFRGRRPKLSDRDLKRIERGLRRGPEAMGFSSGLWTLPRVAELIEQECGVEYSIGHVWRVLRGLGWSPQRPVGRAIERDEAAIEEWKTKVWPRVKKTPGAKGKRSSASTKAASASDPIGSAPGPRKAKRRSSSTTSVGRPSRRSRG